MKKQSVIVLAAAGLFLINSATIFAACPPADFSGDCFVDLEDFAYVAYWWMENCTPMNNFCIGVDLDLSGQVDANDLAVLTADWLV